MVSVQDTLSDDEFDERGNDWNEYDWDDDDGARYVNTNTLNFRSVSDPCPESDDHYETIPLTVWDEETRLKSTDDEGATVRRNDRQDKATPNSEIVPIIDVPPAPGHSHGDRPSGDHRNLDYRYAATQSVDVDAEPAGQVGCTDYATANACSWAPHGVLQMQQLGREGTVGVPGFLSGQGPYPVCLPSESDGQVCFTEYHASPESTQETSVEIHPETNASVESVTEGTVEVTDYDTAQKQKGVTEDSPGTVQQLRQKFEKLQ